MTSNHKGIYYRSEPGRQKRWCARIMVNGKYHNIGNFMTENDAVSAYKNFIDENKDTLPDRAKNTIKYKPDFPRDENGFTHRICVDCGKEDKFKRIPTSNKCKSCGIKESFKHRPAVGLKELDLELAYKDYKSGISLEETGKKYGFSATGLEHKFKRNGYKTRDYKESSAISNNIVSAQQKVKEMCETGEFQKKRSAMLQGIPVEEWTHFITPENLQYYKSKEFQDWRNEILNRDEYICQMCNQKKSELHAHHIKPKAKFWELRTDINNGITLCRDCHFSLNGKEHEYEQFFLDILKVKQASQISV